MSNENTAQRSTFVQSIIQFFRTEHLPPELADVVHPCHKLANHMADTLPSNPELTAGLRKLLEAKDCFVRAKLYKQPEIDPKPGPTPIPSSGQTRTP